MPWSCIGSNTFQNIFKMLYAFYVVKKCTFTAAHKVSFYTFDCQSSPPYTLTPLYKYSGGNLNLLNA